jgi:uncharacterized protein YdeI (YjbR/CyaY-like superfamily)
MEPIFFESAQAFRDWLEANHETATEIVVGYYKRGTRRPSITHPEAVDQALCFGWIDGIRHGLDAERFVNRFTPRKPRSPWSNVNIRRVEELTKLGLMRPAGIRAFEARTVVRSGAYSPENRDIALEPAYERRLREDAAAWEWFQSQPPGYRRTAVFWVMDAKREETRERRLQTLIAESAAGRRIGPLARPGENAPAGRG